MDATVRVDALPLSADLASVFAALPLDERLRLVAGGGDDYELCFTAQPAQHEMVRAAAARCEVAVTKIGNMTARKGALGAVLVVDSAGNLCVPTLAGHDHFGNRA